MGDGRRGERVRERFGARRHRLLLLLPEPRRLFADAQLALGHRMHGRFPVQVDPQDVAGGVGDAGAGGVPRDGGCAQPPRPARDQAAAAAHHVGVDTCRDDAVDTIALPEY